MRTSLLWFAAALAGCTDDVAPGSLLDTGWFVSTNPDGTCVDQLSDSTPEAGEDAWYWRSPLRVVLMTEFHEAYEFRLREADGPVLDAEVVLSGKHATIVPQTPLRPRTAHVLEVRDCDGWNLIPFVTDLYGEPLSVSPASLNGRSYVYDMSRARWTEPANFGAVLALYFTTPVIVGVQYAGDAGIDLLGAMGELDTLGKIRQDDDLETWDFPMADFAERPFFAARTDEITIVAEGLDIRIYDFELEGTFSADGTTIGGTRVSGLGDTRNMGDLVGQKDDPDAMCELALQWSVPCEPCPDGGTYCMRLTATEAKGTLDPSIALRQVAP